MWTCPDCGREFGSKNQHHYCQKEILTIDDYIKAQPEEFRAALQRVRETIRAAAPDASECIKWSMPTFFQKENLIHFACNRKHLGIYPGEKGVAAFAGRLAEEGYESSKGAIRLPWNRPIPYDLITEIVHFRLQTVTSAGNT